MNKELAIKILSGEVLGTNEETNEAIIMAVEALSEHSAEEYRQRMLQAFHNADCDELIAIVCLPTEKEFEQLEWLLKTHYKKKPCEDTISRPDAIAEPQQWIPVTEHLPEEERKNYWICTDTGRQCECRWTNNCFGIGESDEWGWSIFDIPRYSHVVAWMPLPEPYQEGEIYG